MMDENAAYEWLTWLYGDSFEGRIWIGGHADGFRGATFAGVESAVTYAAHLDELGGHGVYHRLTTVGQIEHGRGTAADSVMLPALMADIDVHGPGHKAENLPRDFADVQRILAAAGTPEPSTWVNSGGGLYPAWRLAEPMLLTDETALKRAQQASRRLHRGLIAAAKSLGMKVDNTSDLARVYRLPGTINRKVDGEHRHAKWINVGVLPGGYAVEEVADGWPTPAEPESSLFSGVADGVADDDSEPQSSLFAPVGQTASAHGSERRFTTAEAMAFVLPFLDALATAADGEINVRLNAAACALAHFGPEFWDEAAADRQLNEALACTMYDGLTWKAEDTIASARRAMAGDWRAVFVPPPTEVMADAVQAAPVDAVDALLAEMLTPGQVTERPAPKYMIHGLLQFDSESWIIGPPGSKKSFVVFDMAARVVRGEPWQGRRTNPADVVMIVAEGAGGMGKRVKAWEARNGAIPAGFHILPRPVQASNPAAWAVLVRACARLADAARKRDRGLFVILDTQARVTVGLKENDATDMGVFVSAISAIREATGACVNPIHHTGRAGGDARGSSAIDGAQTTELKVMPGRSKLSAVLSVEKQKDIEEIEPIRLGFEVVEVGQDEDGQTITSLTLASQDSVAFKLAWEGALTGQPVSEARLKDRKTLDPWIEARRPERGQQPTIAWWIVQALVDTAETLGLTQSDVKGIVEEKRGQIDKTTFKRAWQKVTEDDGEWSDVVVKAGGERWTVDRVVIAGFVRELEGLEG